VVLDSIPSGGEVKGEVEMGAIHDEECDDYLDGEMCSCAARTTERLSAELMTAQQQLSRLRELAAAGTQMVSHEDETATNMVVEELSCDELKRLYQGAVSRIRRLEEMRDVLAKISQRTDDAYIRQLAESALAGK
jgi:hypothetical protein